jgi:TRAP-type C4-dicarboxylate transport system permease small subunit
VDSFIEKLEGIALIAILSTMLIVAFTQVVMRNLFGTALSWGDGLTRALVLWAGFVGASLAVKQGRYLNIDTVNRILGERAKRIVRIGVYIFSITVCFMLGTAGVTFVQMEKESGTIYSIGVASWIVELVIPITFFFLALRFSMKLISVLSGEPLEKQEWER